MRLDAAPEPPLQDQTRPTARFLFTCWPFMAHVNPQLGIARALRERGHEVAFYTHSSAREPIEQAGFRVFPFQRLPAERWLAVQNREVQAQTGVRAARTGLGAFRDWLVGSIPEQVADLQDVLPEWQPDVLVSEGAMWGPTLVISDLTTIPVALSSTLIGCMLPGPDAPPWGPGLRPPRDFRTRVAARVVARVTDLFAWRLRRGVDQARARYGLPPMGCSINEFTRRLPLYLVPSIRELDYERNDLPSSVKYVGPCGWEAASPEGPPAWLEQIPTDYPWVHATEGTSHFDEPFVLRAANTGLANQPVRVILTTGGQRDSSKLNIGGAAPNVTVKEWVRHADLLPRCSVLVTTGGAGTILASLRHGVPLIVVPTNWDKTDNAQRVVEAGCGLRLAPKQCTPERLREAVFRILREPSFRINAERMARRLAEAPGAPGAAVELEGLAVRTLAAKPRELTPRQAV